MERIVTEEDVKMLNFDAMEVSSGSIIEDKDGITVDLTTGLPVDDE